MNIIEGEWDFQNMIFGIITLLMMIFGGAALVALALSIITGGTP